MRKLLFFMMLLIILSTSCSKGDDPDPNPIPPPVAELEPSILEFSIAPNDAIIPIYSDIVVKYKGDINTKKISINGVDMPNIDGSYKFSKVGITTKYTIVATNVNKTSTKEINAIVGDWKTSPYGIISHSYWHEVAYRQYIGSFLYLEIIHTAEVKNKKRYYYPNGTYDIFNPDGTKWMSTSQWSLSDDNKIMTQGTTTYSLYEISFDKFTLSREINPVNGERSWEYRYFERQ